MITSERKPWDVFWFEPNSERTIWYLRVILCLICVVYFLSQWSDIPRWYGPAAVLSSENVATFVHVAGLEGEGRWSISPLFVTDRIAIYRGYLLLGVALSVVVMLGRLGRIGGLLLWALFVGWANRSLLLSDLGETLLSLALFSVAFAMPMPIDRLFVKPTDATATISVHWSNRFSQRLLAVHITLIGAATFATMLAERVWWNGLGAYALAAPVEDRSIDWSNSILTETLAHDMATFLLVWLLPIGFILAWRPRTSTVGILTLWVWCVMVALLGSHWLYACTFASMTLAMKSKPNHQ